MLSANALEPPHTTLVAQRLSDLGVAPWLTTELELATALDAVMGARHGH